MVTLCEFNVKENLVELWKYSFEGDNLVSSKRIAYMAKPETWTRQAAMEFMRHFGIQNDMY